MLFVVFRYLEMYNHRFAKGMDKAYTYALLSVPVNTRMRKTGCADEYFKLASEIESRS